MTKWTVSFHAESSILFWLDILAHLSDLSDRLNASFEENLVHHAAILQVSSTVSK